MAANNPTLPTPPTPLAPLVPPKIPQATPDPALVAQTVRSHLPFQAEFGDMIPLDGDASNRRYFRVNLKNASAPRSVVLMQLAEPEAFKQSEEAVSGADVPITELPFINILGHLKGANVLVPHLYFYDQTAGLLYLEDCGDLTLAQVCRQASSARKAVLYREAIDILAQMHLTATTLANPACQAFHRRFDVPLLMWEFEHFLEYGVVVRNGRPMEPEDARAVREEFKRIADLLAAQPRVFTHRDYHSRNLMVRDGGGKTGEGHRLAVLDFQDALLGPATYDLASLLRDAYLEVEEPLIEELIGQYMARMAKGGTDFGGRTAFRRLFDLTSVQRNLKAAGRFVYLDRVKSNPAFLADIPRTLGYVRHNLQTYSELAPLCKHLSPYVPELRD